MNLDKSDKDMLKAIRKQLEFYFSEGNLPHDKFMQNCISSSIGKSVLISDLLKFNKLIDLGATEENILRAVSKSKIVTVDEEGSGIKRKNDLVDLKPANSRTIYICGFPSIGTTDSVNELLRQVLCVHGDIVRVDIPKYPSSNTVKGFAFVEFLTRTASRAALSVHKPTEKDIRKAEAWKYFSYSNSQYNHALKQVEMLGHPQKRFFEEFLGEQRKLKAHDKLIAVAKKEWSQFRTQFYEAQKVHLNEMKMLIAKYQTQSAVTGQHSHKLHERAKAEEVSTTTETVTVCSKESSGLISSGSIVAFNCGEGSTKKTVKVALEQSGEHKEVAYIDFRDFSLTGFLRFKSAESAAHFVDQHVGFESALLLSPSQEREYIERITEDKEVKKESQRRKNERKRNKISDTVTIKRQKIE